MRAQTVKPRHHGVSAAELPLGPQVPLARHEQLVGHLALEHVVRLLVAAEAQLGDLELVRDLVLWSLLWRFIVGMALVAGAHKRGILEIGEPQNWELAQIDLTTGARWIDRALARQVVLGDALVTVAGLNF